MSKDSMLETRVPQAGTSKALIAWLAILMLVMGGTGVVLGLKYSGGFGAASGSGDPEVDLEYRKLPASSKDPWLTEFTLSERSGKLVGTKDLKGRVYVTNFFFSSCPGPCLTQNKKFEEVQRVYAPRGVQFLSISCDPEVDTPAKLREYARKFQIEGDGWWFLTGDLLYIRRVAGEVYRVMLDRQTHTERFIVVDKWGNTRGSYHWSKPAEITDMKLLLDKLLVEKTPPEIVPQESPPPAQPAEAATGEDEATSSQPTQES